MLIGMEDNDLKPIIDAAIPISGLFILALAIAVFFLWRSLNKQVRRIDENLPPGKHDLERTADVRIEREAVERGESEREGIERGENQGA